MMSTYALHTQITLDVKDIHISNLYISGAKKVQLGERERQVGEASPGAGSPGLVT